MAAFFSRKPTLKLFPIYLQNLQRRPSQAIREVIPQLEGSFAFAAIFEDHPQQIFVARQGSLLLIGKGTIKCSSPPMSQPSCRTRTNIRN